MENNMDVGFGLRFHLDLCRYRLIADAKAMEDELTDFGGGAPPEGECSMIYEMWYELVANPIPNLEVAIA
jgi:hypothetical protein